MAHPLEGHRVRATLTIVLAGIVLVGYTPLDTWQQRRAARAATYRASDYAAAWAKRRGR